MKLIMIFILTIFVSIHPQEMRQKPEKDSKFLDIKVDNPELQEEIYNLKKQYDSELNELKVQFKEKKKSLKKSYKGQLKELRKSYKKQKVKKKNKKN